MPKIIKIKGGLGNQLFQYAHGTRLMLADEKIVIFDISTFANEQKTRDTSRPFLLDKFNIAPDARFENITTTKWDKIKDTLLLRLVKDYMFYQNEKYFAPIKSTIIREFTLKDPLTSEAQFMKQKIRATEDSISIHIRRTDYVHDAATNNFHGACGLDYYYKAIGYLQGKTKTQAFFVFSDDIAWAKENLKLDNVTFVSSPEIKDYEELMLMSECRHNIIANSTFSWWAAYLNKHDDKIIVGPKQWNVKNASDTLGILPSSWIQL